MSQRENVVSVTNDADSGQLTAVGSGVDAGETGESSGQVADQAREWEAQEDRAVEDAGELAGQDALADNEAADAGAPGGLVRDIADLEQESEIAADYVEGLLDVADLDGDIDMDVEGDLALVSAVGAPLQEMVGPRGEVLEALQELTSPASHRRPVPRTLSCLAAGG